MQHPPDHFVCVPLVLETLYNKVSRTINLGLGDQVSEVERSAGTPTACADSHRPHPALVRTTLHQIMGKIKSEKGIRGAVAAALISVSLAYVAANRVAQGMSLAFARAPRPLGIAVWAAVVAAVLRPLHALADALVFAKVGRGAAARGSPKADFGRLRRSRRRGFSLATQQQTSTLAAPLPQLATSPPSRTQHATTNRSAPVWASARPSSAAAGPSPRTWTTFSRRRA